MSEAEHDELWAELMPLWNVIEDDDKDLTFYRGLADDATAPSCTDPPTPPGADRTPVAPAVRASAAGSPPAYRSPRLSTRQRPGPVVELGIGYGRLARHVQPDVGVDLSPAALRMCADTVPTVRQVLADVTDYTLDDLAAFTYAPQNLLSLLRVGTVQRFLTCVHRNTLPGGRFAFDAAVPDWDRMSPRLGVPLLRGRVDGITVWYQMDVVDRARWVLEVNHTLEWEDPDTGAMVCRQYPPLAVRYLPPARVGALLSDAGWEVEGSWGGFAGQPLTDTSTRQVWLVRRP